MLVCQIKGFWQPTQKNQQINIFIFIHGMFNKTEDKDSELIQNCEANLSRYTSMLKSRMVDTCNFEKRKVHWITLEEVSVSGAVFCADKLQKYSPIQYYSMLKGTM